MRISCGVCVCVGGGICNCFSQPAGRRKPVPSPQPRRGRGIVFRNSRIISLSAGAGRRACEPAAKLRLSPLSAIPGAVLLQPQRVCLARTRTGSPHSPHPVPGRWSSPSKRRMGRVRAGGGVRRCTRAPLVGATRRCEFTTHRPPPPGAPAPAATTTTHRLPGWLAPG
jgi:hypothetical protein